MDKITVKFINQVSNVASEVCLASGKKTITVNHVIEALKKIGLEKHILLLYSELDPKALVDEEDIKETGLADDMKAKLNGKKRKAKEKKMKKIEMTEDMIREQEMLFQQSQIQYEMMMQEKKGSQKEENANYINKEEDQEENYDD